MKTFFALLISCLTLSAATTYPVLTDSTNRLFPGGATNVFFLNSNVVTTGTMRATGALTLTNASNVFAGDGSGLTGISAGVSKTNGSATNLSVYSSGTTNWPLRVVGTNGNATYINKDGTLNIPQPSVANAPSIKFITADWNLSDASGANGGVYFSDSGFTAMAAFQSGGITISHGTYLGWAAFPNSQVANTAIARSSSGLVEINNATAGQYRDLVVRSLFATNLYATNLIINGGATVTKILSATATLNFDLTALTVEDLTITVTGAADGDVVSLGVPNGSVTTSVQYSAWVSAADTVTVRARTSATGENPASGVFRATVIKH